MAAFCSYWKFTPRQVDELSAAEFRAFIAYANRDIRAQLRAQRKGR